MYIILSKEMLYFNINTFISLFHLPLVLHGIWVLGAKRGRIPAVHSHLIDD